MGRAKTYYGKGQRFLYQSLSQGLVQHAGFGAFVFLVVFCFFAIHAWYQGQVELLESFDYQRQAFWIVFRESLLYTLAMGIPVYFNLSLVYRGPVRRYMERRTRSDPRFKGAGFYFFLVFSLLTSIIFGLILAPIFKQTLYLVQQEWYQTALVALLLIIGTSGVTYTKEAIEKQRELERMERREAIRRRRAAEQQLQFIKKQIRPHFLFNTLANLQILARKKSEELPHLIGELSKMLRYLVYRTDERLVPLEEELNFIESYLDLQQLQLSKGTELKLLRKGRVAAHHRIAPMILIQFIENCFKHYNRKDKASKFIHISLLIEEDRLTATIKNSYKPNARNEDNFADAKKVGGLGLAAAVENIQLIYEGQEKLDITSDQSVYLVELSIPLI